MKHHLEMVKGNVPHSAKLPKTSTVMRDAAVAKIMKRRKRDEAAAEYDRRFGQFGGDRLARRGGGIFLTEPRQRRMTWRERCGHLLQAVRVGCILLVRRLFRRRTS